MPVANKFDYLHELSSILAKIWPKNRTVNIVCHGHSVPCGYFGFHLVNTFSAYPHLLHVKLKERYPMAVINVIVSGIGGENSEAGAARFKSDVLGHKPDLLTIDYGLNDLGIGISAARRAWCSMIEQALAENIKLILMTPSGVLPGFSPEHKKHAEQIWNLAAEYNLGLVDSTAAFLHYCENGGALTDLMSWINHPNNKGHNLIAEELMRYFPILSPEEINNEN